VAETSQPKSLYDVTLGLSGLFDDLAVGWVVIGGVAASTLGKARFTHDLDAAAAIDSDDLERFFREAARFGFRPRVADASQFAKRNRILLLQHEPSGIDVDVSIAGLPFEFEAIARAWPISYQGRQVPIASPEDMVIMKAVAKRPQDLEDIRNLLLSHPNLDLTRVRMYLPQFAEVLDDPALVNTFEQLVAEWQAVEQSDREEGGGRG
jgi:hypothetical protein